MSNSSSKITEKKPTLDKYDEAGPWINFCTNEPTTKMGMKMIKSYQLFLNKLVDNYSNPPFVLVVDGIVGPITAGAHYIIFRTRLEGDPLT